MGAWQIVAQAVVANVVDNLLAQQVEKDRNRLSQAVFQVGRIELFPGEVAGEDHLTEFIDDIDHVSFGRDGFVFDVAETGGIIAVGDDLVG